MARWKIPSVLMLSLLTSACAVGPNFHAPAAPTVSGYTPDPLAATASAEIAGGEAQRFETGADIPGQWWTLFHSPALNALVVDALKANPDLDAAKAALRVANETYYAQRGVLLPTVDAGYTVSRQNTSASLSPTLNSPTNPFTLHTAQVNIAYTLDVFGGVRRQTESVKAQAEAQRFQTQAVYIALTANLVTAAITEAGLREQLADTATIIRAERDVTVVMRRQFALGQIARADLAAQETALAQAETLSPPLRKQLAQQRDLVADLAGRFPSDAPAQEIALDDLSLPQDLPVSLPSKLVEQRPDIRAAQANLHAASAQIGVAVANQLPNITLGAQAGGAATNIAELFKAGNGFWSLAAGGAQSIFEGGTLLHKTRAARAAYDQARAQYRGVVLSAFQNVADVLQALDADARALRAAVVAEQRANESFTITKRQMELGQVSSLSVLSAEQAWAQTRIAVAQARVARYADTAALFTALGGGWWRG